jgi:hypothetical protein
MSPELDQKNVQESEMNQQIQSILAHGEKDYTKDKSTLSPDDEKYSHGFSFAALSFSVIYFYAMGDKLFALISLVGGVFFPPTLFILPFFARARAWRMRKWYDFSEYKKIQKMWDAVGLYGIILLILVFYLSFQFFVMPLFQNLTSSLGTTDLNNVVNNANELLNQ